MFSLGKTAGVSNRVKEKFLGNLLTQYLTPALAMALFVYREMLQIGFKLLGNLLTQDLTPAL